MSIRLKLATSIFVVELAFLVLLAGRDLQIISKIHYQYLSERAENAALRLSRATIEEVRTRKKDDLQGVVTHLLYSPDIVYAFFEDSTGQILAGESKKPSAVSAPGEGTKDDGVLATEANVEDESGYYGRIRLGYSTASVNAMIQQTIRNDIVLSLLGLVVIAAVAYSLGVVLTRSISRVVGATEKIAAGDLDTRVQITSRDEVGRLGRALDSMAVQLKKAFDRIQFSEQQYRFLVENADDAIFALDLMGRFTHVNPKAEEITGFTAQELLRQPISKLLSPQRWTKAAERLEELRQGRVVGPVVVQILGKNDACVVEVNAVPIRRNNHVVGVQGIARDVTARQQQSRVKEAVFRISEATARTERLEDLAAETLHLIHDFLEVEHSAVFLKEPEGESMRLLAGRGWNAIELDAEEPDASAANEESDGRDGSRQGSESLADAFPDEDAPEKEAEHLTFPLRFDEKLIGELKIVKQERRELSEADLAVFQVITNELATGIERKRLEEHTKWMNEEVLKTNARLQETIEMLEKTQRQLIQSEKLSAIGELVSGVAHELNNPLTGVIGFAELLLEQDLEAGVAADLRRIHHEASRCERIVRSLLTIARQSQPQKVLLNVNEILEQVIELRRYHLKVENITLEVNFDRQLPKVFGDPNQLQQVFLNLITNATQAIVSTKQSGKLLVRTISQVDTVRIEVKDDGPGIPSENIIRVFDPFFTTKEVGEGTGLGLSISYSLVEGHGGRIWVDSEEGKGSTFYVELPASPKEVTTAGNNKVETTHEEAAARFLVVDDEEIVIGFMVRLLERDGHSVRAARNAREAFDLLEGEHFDLVISDFKMPGMSGERFFDQLRQARPDLANRVIIMTGDTLNDFTRSFLNRIDCRVLRKPFTAEQVRHTIKETLRLTHTSFS